MHIDLSSEKEVASINAVIDRSKRYWNYSEAYLTAAIPLIQIDPTWLHMHRGYSIYEEDELVGFLGVEQEQNYWTLDHLWISPHKIRTGVGRKGVNFILSEARKFNIAKIFLLPDPPAEGFYSRLGAVRTGKVVQSRVHDGPLFHEMVFELL